MDDQKVIKYEEHNVDQCWKCANMGIMAQFRGEKNGKEVNYMLPECDLHHCFMTEIDVKQCPDFKKR